MKIGLLDVDGHNFPNLALMKISAWHKSKGHHVEMLSPMYEYDKAYMSKVFDFTPDFTTCIRADEIIKGGTGYGLAVKLPQEIESQYPDYELYGIKDTAYGFLTRGCPRGCKFCIVGEKEGLKSQKVADLNQFWDKQKEIKLLDPNILACNEHITLLRQLQKSKASIDFTQGLDARLLTEDNINCLKQLKIKMIHFAWDNDKDSEIILKNLRLFKQKTNINIRKTGVYVLTNFDTSFDFDLYRVYKLKELGFYPYIMVYNKDKAPKKIRHLQRWVNNRIVFNSCEKFEEYLKIG